MPYSKTHLLVLRQEYIPIPGHHSIYTMVGGNISGVFSITDSNLFSFARAVLSYVKEPAEISKNWSA